MEVLQVHPKFVESFCQLERLNKVPEELFMSLGTFVSLLYGDKTSTTVDECRYHLFNSGKYSDNVLHQIMIAFVKMIKGLTFSRSLGIDAYQLN